MSERVEVCVANGIFEAFSNMSSGVYGPGYLDRRKERIKAAYGLDVPGTSS